MNTYEQLTALVPEGEHFDASAINEGIYLTEGHLANIETALLNNAGAVSAIQQQLDEATSQRDTAQQSVAGLNESISTKDARIQELEAQVVELQKKPAGTFSEKKKDEEDHGGGNPDEKYMTSYDREAAQLRELRKA